MKVSEECLGRLQRWMWVGRRGGFGNLQKRFLGWLQRGFGKVAKDLGRLQRRIWEFAEEDFGMVAKWIWEGCRG